ncbi:nephrocystin-4-like [Eucyclogobius newberryi]|uniref:nephrocystin-4-like n=1 Tax=Eucyclogobius newberryi TaxID=166745 RepID=UPI003B5C568C
MPERGNAVLEDENVGTWWREGVQKFLVFFVSLCNSCISYALSSLRQDAIHAQWAYNHFRAMPVIPAEPSVSVEGASDGHMLGYDTSGHCVQSFCQKDSGDLHHPRDPRHPRVQRTWYSPVSTWRRQRFDSRRLPIFTAFSAFYVSDMVKTENTVATVEWRKHGWKEAFDRGRVVPPSRHTSRLAGEKHLSESLGFELSLSRVRAPHLPEEAPEDQNVSYQLRVSLFDSLQQHFFGQTWRSCPQKLKNGKISFNQVLYFHTLLRIPGALLVLELVELTIRADSSHQAKGLGFTLLQPFSSTASPGGLARLNLHHGSPRSLLHPSLKDTTHYSDILRAVAGAHLDCAVRGHSSLAPALHLFPENVLLCGDEGVPGLVDSPSGGALLKPRLLPSVAFSLSGLTVSLKPSVESFENQLLQRVNADCQHMKKLGADDLLRTVVIQERRLHVGVHNGWGFLEHPQVVVLELLPSTGSEDKEGPSWQKLVLRSNLHLSLLHHTAVAIVFQLEYVFSVYIGKEAMVRVY